MAIVYKAPKPKTRPITWVKRVLLRVFFPPVLLWDLAKFLANKLLGKFVGKLILPAQEQDFSTWVDRATRVKQDINGADYSQHDYELKAEQLTVETHDGAKIDGVEIACYHGPKNEKSDTYVFNLVGNSMCYQQVIDEMCDDAAENKWNVIGFNLRGVAVSTGEPTAADDIVVDLIAQIQRLLDQKVSPDKIYLPGHSLGAGVAVLAADHFKKHGIVVNIMNGRSFSNITNLLVGHVRTAITNDEGNLTGYHEWFIMKIFAAIAKPLVKVAVSLVKWEMEAGDAFREYPATHKDYFVAKSSKERRAQKDGKPIDDFIITDFGSMHAYLRSDRRKQKAFLDKQVRELDTQMSAQSSDTLIYDRLKKAKKCLMVSKNRLKARKMEGPEYSDSHNVGSDQIISRYHPKKQTTARQFFKEFVVRTTKHHDEVRLRSAKVR
jgi:pimeloyl-ACP methyl ester carboxylesterase